MWLSESRRFAPDGAKISLLTAVVYKHLAPNGAKPIRHAIASSRPANLTLQHVIRDASNR